MVLGQSFIRQLVSVKDEYTNEEIAGKIIEYFWNNGMTYCYHWYIEGHCSDTKILDEYKDPKVEEQYKKIVEESIPPILRLFN